MSDSMWQAALAHHHAGRFQDAQRLCETMLRLHPALPEALHLLGLSLVGQGRPAEGAAAIERAVALRPGQAEALNSLGSARRATGDLDAAVAAYRRALREKPGYVEAHYNLGNALLAGGRAAGAIDSYRRALALRADFTDARHNLGQALQQAGRLDEAIEAYRAVLAARPAFWQGWSNLATALQAAGRWEEAQHALRAALRVWPADPALRDGFVDLQLSLGNVQIRRRAYEQAVACYDEVLALAPGHVTATGNRAVALRALHRFSDSIAAFRAALALSPDHAVFSIGLATALLQVDGAAEAEAILHAVLARDGGDVEALKALVNALMAQNRDAEALDVLARVHAVAPADAQAHWQAACLHLRGGACWPGWAEYEWRFRYEPLAIQLPEGPEPLWRGDADIAGRTILLHPEQGLGDLIQFVRYVPLLAAQGARVILQVYPPLVGLLASVPGVDRVVTAGEPPPPCDLRAPLLSLPGIFGTELRTVPAQVPYLAAPAEAVARWGARLAEAGIGPGGTPRIGLAFRGGTGGINDPLRPMPPACLRPILACDARFLLLQKDTAAAELALLPGVLDLGPELGDFVDTAAILENLDLVVSVDTSLAHLAGALGRPVWVMLRFAADWRWLSARQDCPWYPTARLFRQARPGDWDGVAQRVAAELRQF